ncbi:MAG: COX15/CtaA family protein [Xanthomonadales bacterium]|nr:COX15/CtaA family protein [Xanthomonadales bacterium]
MKTLTGLSLLLVILLVSLSAYLRLAHSGIGCLDWPDCYGRIGVPEVSAPLDSAPEQMARDAYQRITAAAQQPLAWATPLHRAVASLLGIFIVFLNLLAFHQRRYRILSLALLGLTLWLAMLGLRSGSLHDPAVVMGNLSGGFAMLGLLGWLWFGLSAKPPVRFDAHSKAAPLPRTLVITALLALCLQIALGGLTSANFAANACKTLPDCHGGWLPGTELAEALDLTRHHEVTPEGQAIGGAERMAIHRAHRLMAIVTSVLILLVAQMAMRHAGAARRTGMILLVLIVAEFSVGVAAVFNELPIVLAVAHNWLAGLLLLAVLRLLSLHRNPA